MHPGLGPGQQVDTLDFLTILVKTKIDHQDAAVLASADNAAVVALGGQHPASGPLGEDANQLAAFVIIDAEVEIVGARHDTLVLRVQE